MLLGLTHPFEAKLESITDDDLCNNKLIDLTMFNDSSFQIYVVHWWLFQAFMWISWRASYAKRAFEVTASFTTTYLREAGFSLLCKLPKKNINLV